jgi:Ca-activated chloride channel homolog
VSSRGKTPIALYETGRPATMEAPSALSTVEERTLQRIASISGGRYFRASDDGTLSRVLADIDRLEATERHITEVLTYHEHFVIPLLLALMLLTLDLGLRTTWLRTVP